MSLIYLDLNQIEIEHVNVKQSKCKIENVYGETIGIVKFLMKDVHSMDVDITIELQHMLMLMIHHHVHRHVKVETLNARIESGRNMVDPLFMTISTILVRLLIEIKVVDMMNQ